MNEVKSEGKNNGSFSEQVNDPSPVYQLLVVDDILVNQIIAKKNLKKLGYQCDAVSSGKECLLKLTRKKYDLILMDCQMPEMDGFQTTQKIRSGESGDVNKDIPILAITALTNSGTVDRCLEVGMNSILTKPILINKLKNSVSQLLEEMVLTQQNNHSVTAQDENQDELESLMIFNRPKLMALILDDEDLAKVTTDIFLQEARPQIENLEHALELGNKDQASQHAHAIKGASGNIGAEKLEKISLEIEKAPSLDHMIASLNRLKGEFKELDKVLKEEFK